MILPSVRCGLSYDCEGLFIAAQGKAVARLQRIAVAGAKPCAVEVRACVAAHIRQVQLALPDKQLAVSAADAGGADGIA